jgi:hypothetical protein
MQILQRQDEERALQNIENINAEHLDRNRNWRPAEFFLPPGFNEAMRRMRAAEAKRQMEAANERYRVLMEKLQQDRDRKIQEQRDHELQQHENR